MDISLDVQEWQLVLNVLQQQPWASVNTVINKIMQQANTQAVSQMSAPALNGQHPAPAFTGE